MGFMDDDRRGFLLSMDLLIALIPLTILMGMMVTDMDNVMYTVQTTVYQSSLERVGADTVNTLIKTSGSPYNWEEIGTPQVVGLAKFDPEQNAPVENYLSPFKLAGVKVSDIQNLTGPGYGYYLNITTVYGNRVVKQMGTESGVPDVPNVVRIERLVVSSGFDVLDEINGIRGTGAPLTFHGSFPTNDKSLEAYDYFIVVENRGLNSATIWVNGVIVVRANEIGQHVTEVVKLIDETDTNLKNQTYMDTNIVEVRIPSNPGREMDVYVIAAPAGTPESEISLDNIRPQKCRLEFFIWTL